MLSSAPVDGLRPQDLGEGDWIGLSVDKLMYRTADAQLRRFGPWAAFFETCGREVASASQDHPVAVGLAVPNREFAAAFAGLGVAEEVRRQRPGLSAAAHFDSLSELPVGSRVRRVKNFESGPQLVARTFRGVECRGENRFLVLSGGGSAELVPEKICRDIQPMEDGEDFTNRRALMMNPAFSEAVLTESVARDLASTTSCDVAIVGRVAQLRREIVNAELWAQSPSGPISGCLNDLLRCDQFESNPNDHDRAVLIPSSQHDPQPVEAPVVIFDDPIGFLSQRTNWPGKSWIVLLDRRVASSSAAADALSYEMARKGPASVHEIGVDLNVPFGIEAVAFRR